MLVCVICNRKLKTLIAETLKCKCGEYVCSKHRLPEEHNCLYNHKQEYQKQLTLQLKKLESTKIEKI